MVFVSVPDYYDIVVVGGGIHGVGVAQAAAARGHSVLLLEKNELASGTSSRSSKLIHGGLRYIESGQLSLVRECLRERAILLHIAADLVQLKNFIIPIYRHTRRHPWQLRVGLALYWMMSGSSNGRFCTIRRGDWDILDGLSTCDLQAVFQYSDAQTDDALLTRAVMYSAQQLGAELSVPATLIDVKLHEKSCSITFCHRGTHRTCEVSVLVNAAGPWANDLLGRIQPAVQGLRVELVQGAHIIVPGLVQRGIYYLEAQDGRPVFVMPWHGRTMLGTTETPFDGDPDTVRALDSEIVYLLDVAKRYFRRFENVAPNEIESAFAGLRVLPAGSNLPLHRSRETIFHVDRLRRPRVLTIYGGKLTTYRATAAKALDRLASVLPARKIMADTKELVLRRPASPSGQSQSPVP